MDQSASSTIIIAAVATAEDGEEDEEEEAKATLGCGHDDDKTEGRGESAFFFCDGS